MKKEHNIQTDKELRRILRTGAPRPHRSEWFTRKVMNRLPDVPESSGMGKPEAICYALAAIGLLGGWIYTAHSVFIQGLNSHTVPLIILLPVLSIITIAVFAVPALRRSF